MTDNHPVPRTYWNPPPTPEFRGCPACHEIQVEREKAAHLQPGLLTAVNAMYDATTVEEEEWRQIPSCPGYEISSLARVRAVKRWKTPRLLVAREESSGYLYFSTSQKNRKIRVLVHSAVAEAFHGPRPDGMEIRHLDGDRFNNLPGNLQYGTHSENELDKIRHGTHNHASKTHCAKNHAFTAENTYVTKDGRRQCRTCQALRKERCGPLGIIGRVLLMAQETDRGAVEEHCRLLIRAGVLPEQADALLTEWDRLHAQQVQVLYTSAAMGCA